MHTLAQLLSLPSLDSAIDFSPLTVEPETPVLEAIALMSQSQNRCILTDSSSASDFTMPNQTQACSVLVKSAAQVVGWFTAQDVVRLVASGVDLQTAKISEVMTTLEITLKKSDCHDISSVLSLLRQHQLHLLPVMDEQEEVIGVFTFESICQALDSEKRVEEAEKMGEVLRQLVENIHQVLFVRDLKQDKFIYVSPAYEEIWGRSRDRLEENPQDFLAAIHPEDRDRVIAAIATQESGEVYEQEYRIIRPDKEIRWIWTRAFPLKNELGENYRITGIAEDITDRKQSLEALQQSEKRFGTLVTQMSDAFFLYDLNGKIIDVNQHAAWSLGYSREELLNLCIADIQQSFVPDGVWEFLETGMPVSLNSVHRRKNGITFPVQMHLGRLELDGQQIILALVRDINERQQALEKLAQTKEQLQAVLDAVPGFVSWVNTNKIPFHDAEGNVVGIIGTFEDITERKLAQEALRESEERFRTMADTAPVMIWQSGTDKLCTYFNRGWLEFTGRTLEQELGNGWAEGVHPDDLERCLDIYISAFDARQTFTMEYRLRRFDGEYGWILDLGTPRFSPDGSFLGYIGSCIDISDRKHAEEALRESEERFRLLVEGVKDYAIFMLDPQGRVMSWNPGAERISGYQAAEIIGQHFSRFFPPEDISRNQPNQELEIVATTGRFECEGKRVRKDGSHFWANVVITALRDETGKLRGFCKIIRNITEIKSDQQSLLRFRKAIESTSDAIVITDVTGQVIYLNPAFMELFHYTREQLNAAGGPPVIFTNLAVLSTVIAHVDNGRSWRGEVLMQTRNGRIVEIDLRADAIKDVNGKIVGTVGIHTDITERKQTEENLRLLERAIAASSNGVVISDVRMADMPILYANPAFERITGYFATEVVGQNCRFLHSGDRNQPELDQLRAAIAEAEDCTVVLRNYRKDGTLFWNELSISPVFDPNGNFTHYIGIQTDITERKRAETALLVSQERLKYLLSSSSAVIYSCKPSGDYGATFVSENITAMMGYEGWQYVQDSGFWASHLHPEDATQVFAKLSNLLEQQRHYKVEYRFLHQDGNYRWVFDQGRLVRDEAGNPVEVVGYWMDITERKQLEQELRTALEKEKELGELKSRFVSMTSHEFRTPLSTILSSAELLEHYRHKWTQEKQLTHLHRIQNAVNHMNTMLNDVLVIGKTEAGKLEFKPTPLDLVEYCRHLVEELKLNANNQHAIAFTCQHQSLSCCMDEKLLLHILSNLLSNAIKYSPSDSTVKFTLSCQHQQAVFEIQDQGIGIPSADLPRLFESFHRATNVGNIQGTGLGLAIVKNFVDLHEGKISVQSQLGVGTTFTVTLPLNNQIQPEGNHDQDFSN